MLLLQPLHSVMWLLQNPEVFVHRIGRTARAGRDGAALLLLLPHEDAYDSFLRNRGVAMSSFKETEEGQQMHQAATAAAAEGEEETADLFIAKAETAEVNDALQDAVQQVSIDLPRTVIRERTASDPRGRKEAFGVYHWGVGIWGSASVTVQKYSEELLNPRLGGTSYVWQFFCLL